VGVDHEPDAWVEMPSEESLRELFPPGQTPYDFGFLPAMLRLVCAHPAIAPAFGLAFSTIMFGPGALSRREREMVAGVAAAAQDCFY
jgi:alkylhydroperoxidase/carboxymuconolactone decarboxylase family protein YurZ